MVDIAIGALVTLPLYLVVGIVASITAKRVPWLGAMGALGLPVVWIGKLWTLDFFSPERHYNALYLVSFPILIYPIVASICVWGYVAFRTRRTSGSAKRSGESPA